MPLSSASTTAQVLAAYADNASYDVNDSVAEAKAFIVACRLLTSPQHGFTRSKASGGGGSELEYSPEVLEARISQAQSWLNMKADESGGVRHVDFRGFRD